jgi:hypothetical protein
MNPRFLALPNNEEIDRWQEPTGNSVVFLFVAFPCFERFCCSKEISKFPS